MTILKIKIDKESTLIYGIVMTLSYASYATLIYSFLGNNAILRSVLIVFVLGIDLFAVYKNSGRASSLLSIAGAIIFLYLTTYIVYPENRWVINKFVPGTIKYVMLAFFLSIASEETMYKSLKVSAYFILFCNMFEPITLYVTGGADGYMVYGMRLLIATVLLGFFYCIEEKKVHLCAMLFSMVLILIYGNRSALLISVIVFLIQYVFFANKAKRWIRTIALVVAIASAILLLSGDILISLSKVLENAGISSRTINILLSGAEAVTNNTGRSVIWGNCQKAIIEKPWTGYGIGGERNLYLLGTQYISVLGGVYAHNFCYEILLDFGVVIGSLVLLIIAWKSLCIMKSNRLVLIKQLFTILFLATAFKLWFSSSIWSDIDVYVCLGVAMNYYRSVKKYKLRVNYFKSNEMEESEQ